MKLSKSSTLLCLALTTSIPLTSAASTALFKNYCTESIFLTINNVGPTLVPSGQAYTSTIIGQGNTALVTKNDDPFNAETAKMVLGTSSDLGVLYWSLSSQNGDPFANEHFNITSGGQDATGAVIPSLCQNATSYDGKVHACQDSGQVVLTLFACAFNAAV